MNDVYFYFAAFNSSDIVISLTFKIFIFGGSGKNEFMFRGIMMW